MTRAFTILRSDIDRCPQRRLDASHFREDGTCECMTPAERRELIRAAIHHQGDWQGTIAQAKRLAPLGLIGALTAGSRHYRLTAAGMQLADRLARHDVAAAAERMRVSGQIYERPPKGTLF